MRTDKKSGNETLVLGLVSARLRKGLSQAALGERVGMRQSYVSKIERGVTDLQASTLIELARSLELELMLVPREMVPVVEALARRQEPASRATRNHVSRLAARIQRDARSLAALWPNVRELADLGAAAGARRTGDLPNSSLEPMRRELERAAATLRELREISSERDGSVAMHGIEPMAPVLRDVTNQLRRLQGAAERVERAAQQPAYRLDDDV